MAKKNAFYAQSGGVTAVINASACGVIETARKHKDKIGKVYAGRNGIIGALTEDLIDTSKESRRRDRRAALDAVGRLRLVPLQAEIAGGQQARVRAPDRSLQGARHRLLLLQRRRRLGRHLLQGEPVVRGDGLPDPGDPRARRPSTTTCRSPTAAPASARSRSTSRCRRSKRRSTCARWRKTSTKVFVVEVMGRHAGWIAAAGGLVEDHGIPVVILFPEIEFDREQVHRARRRARQAARLLHGRRLRGLPPPRRHVPRRAGHARRVRPCAARRRRAGRRQHGQAGAGPQVPLGGGRLPAARGAPHRIEDRREAGLRARQEGGRAGASRATTR